MTNLNLILVILDKRNGSGGKKYPVLHPACFSSSEISEMLMDI